jgi:hypothetical protein
MMIFQDEIAGNLCKLRKSTSARISSWDRTGGNDDWVNISPGEKRVLADISGTGCIRHIYFTVVLPDKLFYRDAVLRMFWDGENDPSVEVPIGDFFCVSNCTVRHVRSLLVVINPGRDIGWSNGFNCYFPMPFRKSARIEIENQNPDNKIGGIGGFWYHIDYELFDYLSEDVGYFHAQYRRENPTLVKEEVKINRNVRFWDGRNTDGENNYLMLEAEGQGHVVGLHLQINNIAGGWYGEGDDMIFIDDDGWPPRIHGTGSEEIFGGGACPTSEYTGPYTGFHLIENKNYSGLNAMYRWYVNDPIRFQQKIRMTIEHGHANSYENDYASVVYWYQNEPHVVFPSLPARKDRIPIFPESYDKAKTVRDEFVKQLDEWWETGLATLIPEGMLNRILESERLYNDNKFKELINFIPDLVAELSRLK